ncbi:MAG: YraN family protein [Culturomica sp.]|nr:YraN family protein [Culturomica sp.]
MRVNKKSTGNKGEDVALTYLENCGYRLLARNWRTGHKEVDLIFEGEEMIVVVEVKTRAKANEINPEELLNGKKIENLLRAGEAFLKTNHLHKELRFDLVIVDSSNFSVNHIKEAIQVF